MYLIAVDADGTKENQNSLNASFTFVNDQSTKTFEFENANETSFQHYSYVLPIIEEDSEGSYKLTLGYFYYATCIVYT